MIFIFRHHFVETCNLRVGKGEIFINWIYSSYLLFSDGPGFVHFQVDRCFAPRKDKVNVHSDSHSVTKKGRCVFYEEEDFYAVGGSSIYE